LDGEEWWTIDEIVTAVNIALGRAGVAPVPPQITTRVGR
jgi:hypothetical protein